MASSVLDSTVLLNYLVPSYLLSDNMIDKSWVLFILDDVDVIVDANAEGDDEGVLTLDLERAAVLNALSKAMDLLTNPSSHNEEDDGPPPFILGLSRRTMSRLPNELCRVGRFEKEIAVQAPTQSQREEILQYWLKQLPLDSSDRYSATIRRWTAALSPQLAGCVASDIRRVCADSLITATTRLLCERSGSQEGSIFDEYGISSAKVTWPDVRDAARRCIPSQLEALDVASPRTLLNLGEETEGAEEEEFQVAVDPKRRHEKSWQRFGGYQEVKDKLYRTVVGPWSRHISGRESILDIRMGISPPAGVLFHGPSGVGKTLAAACLASSLGLNVIKVSRLRGDLYL